MLCSPAPATTSKLYSEQPEESFEDKLYRTPIAKHIEKPHGDWMSMELEK